MSASATGKPWSRRVAAIQFLVRELVLVSSAILYPDSRSARSAAAAPGSARHDTVSTPSMSASTARIASTRPTLPSGPLRALRGELALSRRAEPRDYPHGAEPLPDPVGLGLDHRRPVAADVLEQTDRDLAVAALRPAAHDAAVEPNGGSCVAIDVEQRLAVRPEEPGPLRPAHHGRVKCGKQRRPRTRIGGGVEIIRKGYASADPEVYLDRTCVRDRLLDLGHRPARPPLQVSQRRGTERCQPLPGQLRPRVGLADQVGFVAQPVLGKHPPVLLGQPAPDRPTAHHLALRGQHEQDPARDRRGCLIRLTGRQYYFRLQPRLGG